MVSVHTFEPSSCPLCGKQFLNVARMQLHRKRIHQTHQINHHRFNCPKKGCKSSFKHKRSLNPHLAAVHNAKSKSKVSKTFKFIFHVIIKYIFQKSIGKITICAICQVDYKTERRLRHHEKSVHERKFICDFCGYRSAFKSELLNHMGTHNSNKKFKCKVCLKKFQSISTLRKHVHNFHREKTHKCQDCNAAFPIESRLVKHVNAKHKGGRYQCSFAECTSKFTYRAYAGIHLKRIHNLSGEQYKAHQERLKISFSN